MYESPIGNQADDGTIKILANKIWHLKRLKCKFKHLSLACSVHSTVQQQMHEVCLEDVTSNRL